MQSASQAAAFYREVAEHQLVWTICDEDGFPAPLNPSGERAQPFWSSRSRVERIIATVAAYRGFIPVEITLDVFLERWVPGLTRDGILVGVNWAGDRATGYDVAPEQIAECIAGVSRDGP
jgi:hypothetical protein